MVLALDVNSIHDRLAFESVYFAMSLDGLAENSNKT
jgi:hypothetical protein